MMIRFLAVATLISAAAFAAGDPHYCDFSASQKCGDYYVAHSFKPWKDLSATQTRLLNDYKPLSDSGYETWTQSADDHAAAFFAITSVLSRMVLDLGNREKIQATDLLSRIHQLEGDRSKIALNSALFDRWRAAGAKFVMTKADGKTETGEFKFKNGNAWGSSLHKGYDIQAATSANKIPRLQINYRFSDGEADFDVDGYPPFLGGIIPNPKHITYANSDVRQWFDEFVAKFGDPGFRVRPH